MYATTKRTKIKKKKFLKKISLEYLSGVLPWLFVPEWFNSSLPEKGHWD